jgi:hypothetical protein
VADCPCCGLSSRAHRPGCPYFTPEPTVTAEEVAAGIPEDISRAYDRLVADGMSSDKAADMAAAMKRAATSGIGRTLEQQVDHLLELRRSLR